MIDQTTIDLVRNGGVPILMFVVWYLYHKSQNENWQKNNDQNFKILQSMIETNLVNTGILTKIYEKVATNQWCPIVKKILKEGVEEAKAHD